MDNYETIKRDLLLPLTDESPLVVKFYAETESPTQQIKFLLKQLRRAKSTNNRVEMLLNVWYIGTIVETIAETPLERYLCMKLLSPYYQRLLYEPPIFLNFLELRKL